MKKHLFLFILLGFFILIIMRYFIVNYFLGEKKIDETRTVFIKKTEKGFQLFRNGNPFYIRGASGNSYLKELADIGGNTIRVYDTIKLVNILNEAQKNNLAVIVDIPIPKYYKKYDAYKNDSINCSLKQKIKDLIKKHKNHPALLMWNLGNELDYPIVFWKNGFINTFNELIDIIHSEDPDHPVGTSIDYPRYSTIAIYLHSSKLDVFGFNVYGGLKSLISKISMIFCLTKPMPYYISEWGINGPWEQEVTRWGASIEPSSTKKGEQVKERYLNFINTNKQCLGSTVYYWGQTQAGTHTWFSIFDDLGRKSQVYYELKSIWENKSTNNTPIPHIKFMLVENKGARDNLVFKPNEIRKAQIFLEGEIDSTLQFNWEIFGVGWAYSGQGTKMRIEKKIPGCFENKDNKMVTFRVPAIEGPYRIFAYIYDQYGNFATTNTPFYVLNPK